MAGAQLSKTSFGNTPLANQEVVDIYQQESIEAYMKSSDLELPVGLAEEFPTIPPNQLSDLLNDADLLAYLNENNIDFSTFIGNINALLPPGVDLGALLELFDLPFIGEMLLVISTLLGSSRFSSLTTDILITMLSAMSLFPDGTFDTDYELWQLSQGSSTFNDSTYLPMELLYQLGLSDNSIKNGGDGYLSSVIPFFTDNDQIDLLTILLGTAAVVGAIVIIDQLIDYVSDYLSPAEKKKTIKQLLTGYRKPSTPTPQSYYTEAKRFVDQLYAIDSNWQSARRNSIGVSNLHLYRYASYEALLIMKYDERTAINAVIWIENALTPKRIGEYAYTQFGKFAVII